MLCGADPDRDRGTAQAGARHGEDPDPAWPGAAPRGGRAADMSHDVFDTLVAVYALGALDGNDLVQLEAHLAGGCERCEAALRESHEALARLASPGPGATSPAVPPEVKAE